MYPYQLNMYKKSKQNLTHSEKRNMMGDYSELLQLLTSQQETINSLSRTIEHLTTTK